METIVSLFVGLVGILFSGAEPLVIFYRGLAIIRNIFVMFFFTFNQWLRGCLKLFLFFKFSFSIADFFFNLGRGNVNTFL